MLRNPAKVVCTYRWHFRHSECHSCVERNRFLQNLFSINSRPKRLDQVFLIGLHPWVSHRGSRRESCQANRSPKRTGRGQRTLVPQDRFCRITRASGQQIQGSSRTGAGRSGMRRRA